MLLNSPEKSEVTNLSTWCYPGEMLINPSLIDASPPKIWCYPSIALFVPPHRHCNWMLVMSAFPTTHCYPANLLHVFLLNNWKTSNSLRVSPPTTPSDPWTALHSTALAKTTAHMLFRVVILPHYFITNLKMRVLNHALRGIHHWFEGSWVS